MLEVNGVSDVEFLLRYSFDKYRYLMTDKKVISYDETNEIFTFQARFKRYASKEENDASTADTRVLFEVNTIKNQAMTFSLGTRVFSGNLFCLFFLLILF